MLLVGLLKLDMLPSLGLLDEIILDALETIAVIRNIEASFQFVPTTLLGADDTIKTSFLHVFRVLLV